MRSYVKLLILFLTLTISVLPSCDGNSSDDSAHMLAEKYAAETEELEIPTFDRLTVDNSHSNDSTDNNDGIVSPFSDYSIYGDRMYFTSESWMYMDLDSGETFTVCPDPLCDHGEESGCKYKDVWDKAYDSDDPSIVYAVGGVRLHDIRKIDMANDTVDVIYSYVGDEFDFVSLRIMCKAGDELLVTQSLVSKVKTESGEIARVTESQIIALNVNDGSVRPLTESSTEVDYAERTCFATEDRLYFCEYGDDYRLYATDFNLENERTVTVLYKDFTIRSVTLDQNTGEVFVAVASNYIAGLSQYDKAEEVGYIIKIDESTLECEILDMPSDKIINAQITKDYIYYTEYQPLDLGPGRLGRCVVTSGGKIFRTKRGERSTGELVFDGRGELFFGDEYFVCGDYLYLDCRKLIEDPGMTYFRPMGVTARVDMSASTVRWIR